MKRKISTIIALLITTFSYSQNDSSLAIEKDNNLKINVFYLLAGFPEFSYERILDENSAVGVSLAFTIDDYLIDNYNFILSPYYRLYFGNKRAAGFFMETNGAVFSEKYDKKKNEIGAGIGFSIGVKLLAKNNWTGELSFGFGRNFINTDKINDFYLRNSITFGKLF